nr:bifunctional indole-3-glycerol phosphate synthase/phosphoribosylanthranilate isomerase [Chloroflexota bacterium]
MTDLLERPLVEGRHRGEAASPCDTGPRAPRGRTGVLFEIADRRGQQIARDIGSRTFAQVRREAGSGPPARDALGPLLRPGLHVIAEVKRRSPSAGTLAAVDDDVVGRARAYERGGAAIISVLVETQSFGGSISDLRAVRSSVGVPVLAKDFIVDPRQMPLLREAGADLVLLIAALHPQARLRSLVRMARSLGLEPLVEVHDAREVRRALRSDARLIGINNRDLRTLRVEPGLAARLRELIPDDRLVIAESGARDPAQLAEWRGLGFDGALIGEALMTAGAEPDAVAARVAGFVAAGREPTAAQDPAAAGRTPTVKICGITEREGVLAAVRAGADAIGLNFVRGTPRCLDERKAAELASLARSVAGSSRPKIVGIFADAPAATVNDICRWLDLDAVQLSGDEPPEALAEIERAVIKVLHLPAADGSEDGVLPADTSSFVERAAAYRSQPNCIGLQLDTADRLQAGGTGRRARAELAAAVARETAVVLAGGLDPANVAEALR